MKDAAPLIMESDENFPVEPGIEIKASSIEGVGVFARREFKTGEIVLRWDVSRVIDKEEAASLSETEKRYTHPCGGRVLVVQPPERYVNHSCDNNTEVRNFCDVAIRDIVPGEEITGNYSTDGGGLAFDCRCQAANCRGVIGPGVKKGD